MRELLYGRSCESKGLPDPIRGSSSRRMKAIGKKGGDCRRRGGGAYLWGHLRKVLAGPGPGLVRILVRREIRVLSRWNELRTRGSANGENGRIRGESLSRNGRHTS